jgi:hypothetical protein
MIINAEGEKHEVPKQLARTYPRTQVTPKKDKNKTTYQRKSRKKR